MHPEHSLVLAFAALYVPGAHLLADVAALPATYSPGDAAYFFTIRLKVHRNWFFTFVVVWIPPSVWKINCFCNTLFVALKTLFQFMEDQSGTPDIHSKQADGAPAFIDITEGTPNVVRHFLELIGKTYLPFLVANRQARQ